MVDNDTLGKRRVAFLAAATWNGDLNVADQLLAESPELGTIDIFTAAVTGNTEKVKTFLSVDPSIVHATSKPYNTTPLVYLCFSKYLRLQRSRESDFIETAQLLIQAGADANAGFLETGQYPGFETALYGAAGVAHNEALTKLLLAAGADPNDVEVVYHSPEDYDNGAMKALVETGLITPENRVLMLIRKHDNHDYNGVKYLLENGTDPNGSWENRLYPLHHALKRDNHIAIISLLVDYGVNTSTIHNGQTAMARAAWEGRADALKLFSDKAIAIPLSGIDQLVAAFAMANEKQIRKIIDAEPELLATLLDAGDVLIARFSCTGNAGGVQALLEAGVSVVEKYKEGDGYYMIPANSLPIHIAAWRQRPEVAQILISQGSPVNEIDPNGYSPLALAIRACTVSYWTDRRTPEIIALLLAAGAKVDGIAFPTGYDEADAILQPYFLKE